MENLPDINLPYGTIRYSELTDRRSRKQHKTGPRLSVRPCSRSPINYHKEFIMSTITSAIKTFVADEDGVTAIEYGLIAALVGVAMAVAAETLGDQISTLFGQIVTKLTIA